jgi:RNA polymerase primary sigma factor
VSEALSKVNQTTNRLSQRLGRPPTLAEVADELNLSETKLTTLLQHTAEPLSFETTFDSEEAPPTLADFLPDKQAVAPEAAAVQSSLREQLEWILNRLTLREQRVLRMRYGLDDGSVHTLEEVARHLELSRERVRQIEKRALEKLRQDQHVLVCLY